MYQIRFKRLSIGDMFIVNDMVMKKIEPVEGFNALHVATGELYYIPRDMMVTV